MAGIRKRLPGPAMIVAVIALIAALTGSAIAGGVLTTKKFRNQAVRGPVTYVNAFVSVPNTNASANGFNVSASCPAGSRVLGGGIKLGSDAAMFVNDSGPITTGWAGTVYNTDTIAHSANVSAICAVSNQVVGSLPGNP
jgi:hypothetical protein